MDKKNIVKKKTNVGVKTTYYCLCYNLEDVKCKKRIRTTHLFNERSEDNRKFWTVEVAEQHTLGCKNAELKK